MVTSSVSVKSYGWQSLPKFYREGNVLYAQVYPNGKTGDYWQRRESIRNWRARAVEGEKFLLFPGVEGGGDGEGAAQGFWGLEVKH